MADTVRLCLNQEDHLLDIRRSWWRNQDTDLVLVSGPVSVDVHGAVLLPLSQFLAGLVPDSCPCTKPAIILPPQLQDVLPELVELLYIGTSKVDSKDAVDKVHDILKLLQIDVDLSVNGWEDFHGVEQRVEGCEVMDQDQLQLIHQDVQLQPADSRSVHRELDGPVVFNASDSTMENEHLPLMRREKSAGTNNSKLRKSKRMSVRVVTQSENKQIMDRMEESKLENRHFPKTRKQSSKNNPAGCYMDGSLLEEGIIPIMDLPSMSGKQAGGETLCRDKPKNRKRRAGITSGETSSGKKKTKRIENVEPEKGNISNESNKRGKLVKVFVTNGSPKEYENGSKSDSSGGVYNDGSLTEKGIIPITDLPRLSAKIKKNRVAQNKRMKTEIIEYPRKNDVCNDERNDDDEEIEEIPRLDDDYLSNGIEISDFRFSISIKYPSREKP